MTDTLAPTASATPAPAVPAAKPARRRPRWAAAGTGIAAAAAAIVVAAVAPDPSTTPQPQPQAMVLAAARQTAAQKSMRGLSVTQTTVSGRAVTVTSTVEAGGGNFKQTMQFGPERSILACVDLNLYSTNVQTGATELVMDFKDMPEKNLFDVPNLYGAATRELLDAAATGTTADQVSEETVRGTTTTHYRVDVTDATRAAVAKAYKSGAIDLFYQFNDEPNTLKALDVWVGKDKLVHRLQWTTKNGSGTDEFYDFGAPITVTAPKVTG